MRWIVGSDDGRTVRDVLARANADPDAVREGRVFVGPRRVRQDDERVDDGDVVAVSPPLPATDDRVCVLAETDELVAVDKPAGVPTIADHAGASHSLLARSARTLGVAESGLHATSRLDRDVSGVVLFARTAAAAGRLAQARVEGTYHRRYVAVAGRAPTGPRTGPRGTWDAPIGRARDPRLRAVGGRDATHATTHYAVCGLVPGGAALLGVVPVTGRTHQIRVHAAHGGAPLVGDRAYGGPARLTLASGRVVEPRRIALHAARVVVPDGHGGSLVVIAPIPAELAEVWSSLGGDPDAWEAATSCSLD
jgi:23S rRNA pseudouridine1911/1915/1917 synthase